MTDMNELIRRARLGNEAQRRLAVERAEPYRPFFAPLVEAGWSYGAMTRSAEAYRLKTPTGRGRWHKGMVARLVRTLGLVQDEKAAA